MALFSGLSLEYLNLSACGKITDESIEVLSQNCTNINRLSMANCWKLTDLSLNHIGKRLVNLTTLDISHCNKLNGSGFQGHKLNKLTNFNCSFCKALGDKALEKLLSGTLEMTEMRIRRCTRLSEFGIFLIIRFCR